jgi:hypothetical protein
VNFIQKVLDQTLRQFVFKPTFTFSVTSVGNVGPKSDHVERSDLAKRFFTAGWERKRA